MDNEFSGLPPIQKAILERIIEQGSDYSPFTEASLKAYSNLMGETVTVPDVQGALNALRQKNLIWQAAYGEYALEDDSMGLWFKNRV